MTDLRTENERKRDVRNARICSDFKVLREQLPTATLNRLALKLATDYKMTSQSIRNILSANQLI